VNVQQEKITLLPVSLLSALSLSNKVLLLLVSYIGLKMDRFAGLALISSVAVLAFEVLPMNNPVMDDGMMDSHNMAVRVSNLSARFCDSRPRNISARNNSNNPKFIHSSIRIEQDVFNTLQTEAQRRGVSFNSLVNNTLKNYVTSEMYFEQLGFILISKDFLRKTFSRLDQNYVEEFGKEHGLTVTKEYISYFFTQVNNNTLIEFLDIWFRRFQFYQHRVKKEGNDNTNPVATGDDNSSNSASAINKIQKQQARQQQQEEIHSFIINHDINMNFSLVLKAILEGLIESITKSPIDFKIITDTSITFSIKL
jgi:hypothetical protein